MFYDGWTGPPRTLVVGVLAYTALVALLRVSGKRTLGKWNAFDLVVTVAFGSTLSTALLSRGTSLFQVVCAFAVLVGLQFTVTWLSVRSPRVSKAVKSSPALLLHRGVFLDHALRRERVSEAEVRAAIRASGIAAMEDVHAVVLETDGTLSVIADGGAASATVLRDVERAGRNPTAGGT
ncbi:MAG TPA: YetF domain-containing protein [Longimicrobium sp.]|nr:YetF domain-containing protein [Longimicrobium sp.]